MSAHEHSMEFALQKLLYCIVVGALPDMVKFTSDCSRLLVAMEGELVVVDGEAADPEGETVIIDFESLPGSDYEVRRATFQKFNDL